MPPSGVALTIRPVAHRAAPSPGIMLACVADAPRDPSHEERNSTQAPRRSNNPKHAALLKSCREVSREPNLLSDMICVNGTIGARWELRLALASTAIWGGTLQVGAPPRTSLPCLDQPRTASSRAPPPSLRSGFCPASAVSP